MISSGGKIICHSKTLHFTLKWGKTSTKRSIQPGVQNPGIWNRKNLLAGIYLGGKPK